MKVPFRRIFLITILLVSILGGGMFLTFLILSRPLGKLAANIYDSNYFIAHAGGAVDDINYLNCKEGLEQSICRGYKYIEFDLCKTDDEDLVCAHDKEAFYRMIGKEESDTVPFDSKTFKSSLLYGKYHTLNVTDLKPLLKQHSFTLVTDCYSEPDIINSYFSEVKRNVIIEASNIENYNKLRSLDYTVMLTMGDFNRRGFWDFVKLSLTNEFPIDWIVISATQSDFRYVRLLKRLFGVRTAMYTTNDKEFFINHIGVEADLVYTDNWQFKD